MSARAVDRELPARGPLHAARGRVYLTGVQALVRLPLDQRRRDAAAGLRTAGFISGYRGSPLGTYDLALWQAKELLDEHHVRFEPGVNEDLAATAVWGSQQANLLPGPKYDGVFGMWYGKGPGVDRSCDALKHGNYAGASPKGGVLVLTGDDPGAKSSSIAHQSEHALIHCGIPVLNPSSVQEYLDLGLYGFALSRYSGCWVGLQVPDRHRGQRRARSRSAPSACACGCPRTSRGRRACTSAGRTPRSRSRRASTSSGSRRCRRSCARTASTAWCSAARAAASAS